MTTSHAASDTYRKTTVLQSQLKFPEASLAEFRDWLERRVSHRHAGRLFNLAQRYAAVLDGKDASVLIRLQPALQHSVMEALAAWARFRGIYGRWREIRDELGLTWHHTPAPEVFRRLLEAGDGEGVEKEAKVWLDSVLPILPYDHRAFLGFMTLTGLRLEEACNAIKFMRNEPTYCNDELGVLQHFRFPDRFLHGTKNAYISFTTPVILRFAREAAETSTNKLRLRLERAGVSCKTRLLRSRWATYMADHGLRPEMVDLLQGRISPSVFARHYDKPSLRALGDKVREALKPLEKEMLSLIVKA